MDIDFDPDEWDIPHKDMKLYGGQQFERLLAEFRVVSNQITIQTGSLDDIATASGLSGLKYAPNYVWVASDIVQRKSREVFIPLLKQLIHRATYVIKRLFDIVENILEAKRKRTVLSHISSWETQMSVTKDFPQFTWYVRELYDNVVDNTAAVCLEKCVDELYCTQLIFWEQTSTK